MRLCKNSLGCSCESAKKSPSNRVFYVFWQPYFKNHGTLGTIPKKPYKSMRSNGTIPRNNMTHYGTIAG